MNLVNEIYGTLNGTILLLTILVGIGFITYRVKKFLSTSFNENNNNE